MINGATVTQSGWRRIAPVMPTRATDHTFWWKEDSPIVSVPTGATDHTFWGEEDILSV